MEELERRIQTDNSDVGRILRALFLPKLYGDNLRLASEGAGVKTAALNLSYLYDITDDWTASNTNGMLSASDEMLFVFGNPLRSAIVYYHNNPGSYYAYDIYNSEHKKTWDLTPGVTMELRGTYGLPALLPIPSAWSPHGPVLFAGYDRYGHNYVWVDGSPRAGASNTLAVFLDPPPATTAERIEWWIWDGMKAVIWDAQSSVALQAAYQTVPPLGGAYMFATVRLLDKTSNVLTGACQVIGNRDCWGHKALVTGGLGDATAQTPDTGLLAQTFGIRVNAAAVKCQNNSQEINKNGNIISCTVAKGIPWSSIALGGGVLSNLQNYRERVAENGYYGVLLPDSDDDISEFYDDITTQTTFADVEFGVYAYPLTERRPYKAVSLAVPLSTGRSFAFDITHCIEFLTNSDLASIDVSPFSEDSLIAAIVAASTMETDYENPTHWRKILGTIGRYGSRAIGALLDSGAIEALGGLHPALKGPAMIGQRIGFPLQREGLKRLEKWAGDSYRNNTLDKYTEEFA